MIQFCITKKQVQETPMFNFADLPFVIASMHGKWEAIAPHFTAQLHMRFEGEVAVDTDALGTFSGEVERTLDPLRAAREKCRLALLKNDSSAAIATEGSFFPHPAIPFAAMHSELILFYFPKENFELSVVHNTTTTNFNGKLCETLEVAKGFAKECLFPSHGIILKSGADDLRFLHKTCSTWQELEQAAAACLEQFGQVYLETDMRAMRNPTRLLEIGKAAQKLAQLLSTNCPQCTRPGFGFQKSLPGLECELCSAPTYLEKSRIECCSFCHFSRPVLDFVQKEKASAQYCDFCNP
jgi:hypothetical protein